MEVEQEERRQHTRRLMGRKTNTDDGGRRVDSLCAAAFLRWRKKEHGNSATALVSLTYASRLSLRKTLIPKQRYYGVPLAKVLFPKTKPTVGHIQLEIMFFFKVSFLAHLTLFE